MLGRDREVAPCRVLREFGSLLTFAVQCGGASFKASDRLLHSQKPARRQEGCLLKDVGHKLLKHSPRDDEAYACTHSRGKHWVPM